MVLAFFYFQKTWIFFTPSKQMNLFSVSPYTFTVCGGSPRGSLFPNFSHESGADDPSSPPTPQSETHMKSAS